ncbi:MAG: hypothetical protein QM796_16340 [Chthoniobacteraceae bacterium]
MKECIQADGIGTLHQIHHPAPSIPALVFNALEVLNDRPRSATRSSQEFLFFPAVKAGMIAAAYDEIIEMDFAAMVDWF